MTIYELEGRFARLGKGYKTADLDRLNKRLIKEGADVSFLKDIVLSRQELHRTYFQVSMGKLRTDDEKLSFIEDNFHLLADWWHVDQLTQFLSKNPDFDLCISRAREYIKHPHPFARRWGYVLFMPSPVKQDRFEDMAELFRDDDEYYVVMAEAWLISYLAIYHPEKTLAWLKTKPLKYNIVGRGIQKICDSYRIDDSTKARFKEVRRLYKEDL